jgi:hypothetical protein
MQINSKACYHNAEGHATRQKNKGRKGVEQSLLFLFLYLFNGVMLLIITELEFKNIVNWER